MQMEEMIIEECKFCGHLIENHKMIEFFNKMYLSCLTYGCITIIS